MQSTLVSEARSYQLSGSTGWPAGSSRPKQATRSSTAAAALRPEGVVVGRVDLDLADALPGVLGRGDPAELGVALARDPAGDPGVDHLAPGWHGPNCRTARSAPRSRRA